MPVLPVWFSLIALIIISFITSRIADFIIDSRIGALDRTLGFLFGAARGLLLLVVAVAFWNWLVDVKTQPEWVTAGQVQAIPGRSGRQVGSGSADDIEPQIRARILGKKTETTPEQRQQKMHQPQRRRCPRIDR